MKNPVEQFHALRLDELKAALEANNFEVWIADTAIQAKEIAINEIIPRSTPRTISWGGSMTFMDSGIEEALKTLTAPASSTKRSRGSPKRKRRNGSRQP